MIQRGRVTCPRPHSLERVVLGFESVLTPQLVVSRSRFGCVFVDPLPSSLRREVCVSGSRLQRSVAAWWRYPAASYREAQVGITIFSTHQKQNQSHRSTRSRTQGV